MSRVSALGDAVRGRLAARFLGGRGEAVSSAVVRGEHSWPEAWVRFDRHPAFERLVAARAAAARFGVVNPFFLVHEGVAGATSRVNGREVVNFCSYDYLGLSGHAEVARAVGDAVGRFGSSVSASRLVAGERRLHQELERALADVYGVEDCVAFVSGHATNMAVIASLLGPRDLLLHDELIHNSVLEGGKLAGCLRRGFRHNDLGDLERVLGELRSGVERVLVVVEGLYSMDGDVPDLPALVALKRRFGALLMVDEAHSLGVLGKRGLGLRELWGVDGSDVDVWMGTLSKSLVSCGGFVAGCRALVELLKYSAPGFVYSVGLPPAAAAASLAALRILLREPERVQKLQENGAFFLNSARSLNLDVGFASGFSVCPVLTRSSLKAASLSHSLLQLHNTLALPILYPAVPEKLSRIRIFLSSLHSIKQIENAVENIASLTKQ